MFTVLAHSPEISVLLFLTCFEGFTALVHLKCMDKVEGGRELFPFSSSMITASVHAFTPQKLEDKPLFHPGLIFSKLVFVEHGVKGCTQAIATKELTHGKPLFNFALH